MPSGSQLPTEPPHPPILAGSHGDSPQIKEGGDGLCRPPLGRRRAPWGPLRCQPCANCGLTPRSPAEPPSPPSTDTCEQEVPSFILVNYSQKGSASSGDPAAEARTSIKASLAVNKNSFSSFDRLPIKKTVSFTGLRGQFHLGPESQAAT